MSFDPHETSEMAAAKKASYMKEYDRDGSEKGWHFLTAPEASSRSLADAVGFLSLTARRRTSSCPPAYRRNPDARRTGGPLFLWHRLSGAGLYASASVEGFQRTASRRSIAVLLYCYHYDPANGKYGLAIMNALRIGGGITLACLLTFMIVMFRRDFRSGHAGTTKLVRTADKTRSLFPDRVPPRRRPLPRWTRCTDIWW